ncbi:hypothetical protein GHH_c14010 [Geobacillus sp. GHH01]|jgi:hypothetical protein|nr:hypothetical protein GHH_c14010 [Geobacillus sp. GHH01]EPR28469.1 hypothetical protein I656_01867 [Geobacillus sp. WSUCF1]KPD00945.1 hypothetical protein LR69_00726 [Geobacillus sp. BCO2]
MWIITLYAPDGSFKMFEFDCEQEARQYFRNMTGTKILSQIIYGSNLIYGKEKVQ